MKRIALLPMAVAISAMMSSVQAYPTVTHTAITGFAIATSNLTDDPKKSPIIGQLGIAEIIAAKPDAPFEGSTPNQYIAIGNPSTYVHGSGFEALIMDSARKRSGVGIPNDYALGGWLIRGVIREDDNDIENAQSDDPGGVFARPFGHFFDPQNNRGLTVLGRTMGARAIDWALTDGATVRQSAGSSTQRANSYNLPAAREALFRAMTGLTKDGLNATPGASDTTPANAEVRKAYWASTFRTLGDVVHLLQDMGQPQHTRNDAHSGLGCFLGCAAGHASFYENYIGARTVGDQSFRLDEGFLSTSAGNAHQIRQPGLTYGGYPKPTSINRFQDFFSTGEGAANHDGQGLANYSNRGFYSFGANFGDSDYPYPSVADNGLVLTTFTDAKDMTGTPLNGAIRMYVGSVMDTVTGIPDTGIRFTTRGVWDQFVEQKGLLPSYTLNYMNYDDQAALLVPRAGSYSAALIDYFFRGTMKISLPDEGVYSLVDHSTFSGTDPIMGHTGFKKIKLKLANTTPDIGSNKQDMPGGKLYAVVKYKRDLCYTDNLEGYPPVVDASVCRSTDDEVVTSQPANGGALTSVSNDPQNPTALEFNFDNGLPINATDVRLQVVYRGQFGAEADGIAVATQDMAEPTYFTYMNATDYYVLANKVYTRDQINADQSLLNLVYPQSCVDRTLATPQLKPDCLQPFNIDVGLTVGGNGKETTISITALPPKKYLRLALLGDATTDVALVQSASNTCYPHDAYAVTSLEWQETYQASDNTLWTTYPEFQKVRGIAGWYSTSCVGNGDGSTPGSPDNRNQVMSALGAVTPTAVTINNGNGF